MKKNVILWLLAIIIGIPLWLMTFSYGSSMMNQPSDIEAFIGYATVILSIALPVIGVVYLAIRFMKKKLSANASIDSIGVSSRRTGSVPSLALIIMMGATMLSTTGCNTKVRPGWVGIRVNNVGSGRGVQDIPIVTGLVWYNPFTEDIYQYPTFTTTVNWTYSLTEGKPVDQSMSFNSVEGAVVNADVSGSYAFKAEKVPYLFVKFRETPDELADTYIRSRVRDHLNENAAKMRIVDIFGLQKQVLLKQTLTDLRTELGPLGIDFQSVSFINALRVDNGVRNSINNVIAATQQAIAAENKVREIKAIARQDSVRAAGQEAALKVNPRALEWKVVERWDGHLPLVNGSSSAIINLPNTTFLAPVAAPARRK